MNCFNFVIVNNPFHEYLKPRRHTYYNPDIPVSGFFNYFIKFCRPVTFFGYAVTRLVKMLKPEWNITGGNARKITFIISAIKQQMGASAQHQNTFFIKVIREIILGQ